MRLFPGTRPKTLGIRDGHLAPPPGKPNGVSSEADRNSDALHFVEPFECRGDCNKMWRRLSEAIRALPGVKVIADNGEYLHAECSSKVLGFVDDLELRRDRRARLIHVRSAARLGFRDFDVNRKRVESLRAKI